jgi:hypothetical protein
VCAARGGGRKLIWNTVASSVRWCFRDAKALASEVTSFGVDESIKGGKRRCVVVVPKKAAPGNPWSWRGCYWNHEPQSEAELLRRGFHIAFVAPDPGRQGKAWALLHVVGTEDFVLQRHTMMVERMYHQLGGSITVIMKEGVAHHPHRLEVRGRVTSTRMPCRSWCRRSRRRASCGCQRKGDVQGQRGK